MDPSLVVLLCVFVISVLAHGALSAYSWSKSSRSSQEAANLLSSAVECTRTLEKTVAQRSSMADEVAALRQPLTESVVQAKMLSEEVQKATKEMAGNLLAVPRMIELMAEMAKKQVELLEAVQVTAKTLHEALYSKDAKQGYKPYDAAAADREYETQQLQRSGLSRQEAEERAGSKMWDGFSITR